MRCNKVQQKLNLFDTQELAPSEREKIDVHLKSCAQCRQTLARVRRLEGLLTAAPTPPVPGGFAARVIARAKQRQAIVARSEPRPRVSLRAGWRRLEFSAGTAAALAAGLLIGVAMGQQTWQRSFDESEAERQMVEADPIVASGFSLLAGSGDKSLGQVYLGMTRVPNNGGT